MVNDHVRRLGLVLGDQLSFDLSLFDELDPAHDALLMAEVREEASYVPHHPTRSFWCSAPCATSRRHWRRAAGG